MATTPNTDWPAGTGTPSSLATRSLILVLSGYLVGITASHICSPAMEGCALAAAAIGMIAQAVFASHSRLRQAQDDQLAMQKATVRLERRVEQHVRIPSIRPSRRLRTTCPRAYEQYITVVRSPRSMR
jgi:hypothetical protein